MTRPFLAANVDDVDAVIEVFRARGGRWPDAVVSLYLTRCQDLALAPRPVPFPSRRVLSALTGWTEGELRTLLRDVDRWGDPRKSADWRRSKRGQPADDQPTTKRQPADDRTETVEAVVSDDQRPSDDPATTQERPRDSHTRVESHFTSHLPHEEGERADAPAPEQPKATNVEPKPRTKVTGSSQMPTSEIADPDEAARIRESVRERIAHHAGSCPIAITDWKPLHNLAAASGYDEAVALRAIDWLYTAADDLRWGGNEAAYTVGRGVRGALENRSHRLVEASAAWDRAGRPTRATTKPTADGPAVPSATPVWDSMREAIERLPYRSIFGERTQAGVMLHPDPAEHARRALAFRRAGDRDGYLSTLETFGDAARAAAVARFAASFERHYAELAAVEAA